MGLDLADQNERKENIPVTNNMAEEWVNRPLIAGTRTPRRGYIRGKAVLDDLIPFFSFLPNFQLPLR